MTISKLALTGCLLGTAVGDAMGLPYEGLSRRRAARLFREPDRYRLLPGRGMVSDDTEHACMTMQALIASGDNVELFARELAWRLRLWLLGLPAGTGMATLKASTKLCLGVSPHRSGVCSAGNGPAMRSVVLGPAIDDVDLLRVFVRVSTRMTHTDPKAEYGALAIALAAHLAASGAEVEGQEFQDKLARVLADEPAEELLTLVERVLQSASRQESTLEFADSLGLEKGVSGYIYHTVPVVLHAWLRHQHDLRSAVVELVRCGGDTDSTAALAAGIIGSGVGRAGIPSEWLDGLCEWPRTVHWMERLAGGLYEARLRVSRARPPRLPVYGLVPRNLFFLAVVLTHGFRRLLPPY